MITQTEIQSNRTIIDTAKRRIIERHPEMSKMAEAAAYYVNRDGRFATRCDGRHHTDWCIEPVYEENNQ